MTLKQAIAREPVSLGGLTTGVLLFVLVRWGHMSADAAQQALAGALPVLGALVARQFVTPTGGQAVLAELKPFVGEARSDAVKLLTEIRDALTITEPAVKVLPPVTDVPLPDGMAVPSVTTSAIPAPPEPWTPPALDIPPILGAMTATPAAPTVDTPPVPPEPTPAV